MARGSAISLSSKPALLSIEDLGVGGIHDIMNLADAFEQVNTRAIRRVPALNGKSVATVFFENSTRTRLSFETAAKRLSAETMTFSAGGSSLSKGESLRDTVETIDAMGVDAMVVRHSCAGVPTQVDRWVKAVVINAGDGSHEHPTQALLDTFTLLRSRQIGDLSGLRIGIVGDIAHSRVARSNVLAFGLLGASVVLVAPPTFLPMDLTGWPVEVSHDLDKVLPSLDVVYMLRIQAERMVNDRLPSIREYSQRFGLGPERADRMKKDAVVMHPGPMNRGVELAAAVADGPRSLILDQVANGVPVRMAVLFSLLGSATSLGSLRADPGSASPGGPGEGEPAPKREDDSE